MSDEHSQMSDEHSHEFNEEPDRETIAERYYDCKISGCPHIHREVK